MYTKQKFQFNKPDLIKTLLCFGIIVLFWLLPPLAPITKVGMRTIGVFIGTVLLLTLVDTTWPAFLSFALLSITGSLTMNEVLAGSIGNWIITFVIASFVLTDALNSSGFTRRLTVGFMTRPFVSKSPWLFTISYLFIAWVVGLFMDSVAAVLFFLPFTSIILQGLGYTRDDTYSHMLTIGVVFAINIAGIGTPISHSLMLLGMGILSESTGMAITMFDFIKYGLPLSIILFFVLIGVLKLFFKVDLSNFKNFDIHKTLGKMEPMDLREKTIVSIFFGTVFFWVFPGILDLIFPAGNVLTAFLSKFSITFWALLGMVLLAVIRINDKPIVELKSHLESGFNWGIIFFIAIGVLLGSAMSHPSVGLNEFIIQNLTPVLDKVPTSIVILVIASTAVVLTNVASNVTTITIMTTVAVSLAASLPSVDLTGLAFTATASGALAFVLPSSYASIALLHGDRNTQPVKIIKTGIIMVVLCSLVVAFVGYPLFVNIFK